MLEDEEKVLPWPDDTGGRGVSGKPPEESPAPLDVSSATESPAELLGRLEKTRAGIAEEEFAESPIVRLVKLILVEALQREATEIHLEPQSERMLVRYRVDGVLQDALEIPKYLQAGLLARFKVLAKMDIAERRLPQDGRITVTLNNQCASLWVSSLPTVYGERIILRILGEASADLDLGKLGFEEDDLRRFRKALEAESGLILAAGPTESGKSTTLYAALSALNRRGINVIAIEEVVTRKLPGITQVQLAPAIGFSFGGALRSAMRQNPDVLLIGAIYEYETAEAACKAATTGVRTFATLPVLDAVSAVVRLLNMGLEPFLVSSALLLVVAQRLCRRICAECRERVEVPVALLMSAGLKPEDLKNIQFYRGRGCDRCANTGYQGRVAIHQVLSVTPEFREAIGKHGGWADPLKEVAARQGMGTLREAGLRKVIAGITTLDEVVRTTPRD